MEKASVLDWSKPIQTRAGSPCTLLGRPANWGHRWLVSSVDADSKTTAYRLYPIDGKHASLNPAGIEIPGSEVGFLDIINVPQKPREWEVIAKKSSTDYLFKAHPNDPLSPASEYEIIKVREVLE